MSAVDVEQLRDAGSQELTRLMNFSLIEQRHPFSPIWESHVYGLLQPSAQRVIDAHKEGQLSTVEEINIDTYIADLKLHPFNLSNPDLNVFRANHILTVLDAFRCLPNDGERRRTDWWPQDPAVLVELIKKEREEVDTLGHIDVSARGEA